MFNITSKLIIKAGKLAGNTVSNVRTTLPRVKTTLKTSKSLFNAGYRSVNPAPPQPKKRDMAQEILDEFKLRHEAPKAPSYNSKKGVYHAS